MIFVRGISQGFNFGSNQWASESRKGQIRKVEREGKAQEVATLLKVGLLFAVHQNKELKGAKLTLGRWGETGESGG